MQPDSDSSLRLRRALWALLAVSALSLVIFGLLIATLLATDVLDVDPDDDQGSSRRILPDFEEFI